MADDTQNPQALEQAQAALAQAEAQSKADGKIKKTDLVLARPVSFGGVDYAKGRASIPTAALEAEQHFADALEADGDLSYSKDTAADGAPRTTAAAGTTTPARKR